MENWTAVITGGFVLAAAFIGRLFEHLRLRRERGHHLQDLRLDAYTEMLASTFVVPTRILEARAAGKKSLPSLLAVLEENMHVVARVRLLGGEPVRRELEPLADYLKEAIDAAQRGDDLSGVETPPEIWNQLVDAMQKDLQRVRATPGRGGRKGRRVRDKHGSPGS